MKNKQESILGERGFTLVELMVVVAIIGLLSAVAIPNFQKYQSRTKTTEAKLQLAALYTAEQSFYSDYNMYHICLRYMGYDPQDEVLSRYYTVGFSNTAAIEAAMYASASNSGLATNLCDINHPSIPGGNTVNNSSPFDKATYYLAGKKVASTLATVGALTSTAIGTQADESNQIFTAGAAGIVHKKFSTDALSSYMTIDQAKVIRKVRNGF